MNFSAFSVNSFARGVSGYILATLYKNAPFHILLSGEFSFVLVKATGWDYFKSYWFILVSCFWKMQYQRKNNYYSDKDIEIEMLDTDIPIVKVKINNEKDYSGELIQKIINHRLNHIGIVFYRYGIILE